MNISSSNLRTADVFPGVASLPPKNMRREKRRPEIRLHAVRRLIIERHSLEFRYNFSMNILWFMIIIGVYLMTSYRS